MSADLIYNNHRIHDRGELLSMTDMWRAAGGMDNKRPYEWLRLPASVDFCDYIATVTGLSRDELIQTLRGNEAGTWAHWQIGMAYAKYLSPKFHAWCNQVVRDHMLGRTKPALPDFTNPAEAARAWANEFEAKQAALAKLEAAQPAIEFHSRVGDTEGLHSIDEVAKVLRAPPRKFRTLLRVEFDLFRQDGLPKQNFIDLGYVRVVEQILEYNRKPYPQTFFTNKGLMWIQRKVDHSLMGWSEE